MADCGRRQVHRAGDEFLSDLRASTASNGFFDTAFGNNGSKLVNVGGTGVTEIVHAVALQSDGKIVLAGACGPKQRQPKPAWCACWLMVRSIALSGFPASRESALARSAWRAAFRRLARVAVLPDGKLLPWAMSWRHPAVVGTCVVRLNSNGSLDTSYANAGRTIAVNALKNVSRHCWLRADGRCFHRDGGQQFSPRRADQSGFMCRTAAGALGQHFGNASTTGTQVLEPAPNKLLRMALQPDSKVITFTFVLTTADIQAGKRLDIAGQIDANYKLPRWDAL